MKLNIQQEINLSNCTLLEACFIAAGGKHIRAGKCMSFIIAWRNVSEVLGRRPTQQEYADYWKMDLRTATREIALFRSMFPGAGTPDDLPEQAAEPLEVEDYSTLVAVTV